MNTDTQRFANLLTGINERMLDKGMPTTTVCGIAEFTVAWANQNPLDTLGKQQVRMLSQIMSILGSGVTGNSEDAYGSLRRLKATVPIFQRGLSKR